MTTPIRFIRKADLDALTPITVTGTAGQRVAPGFPGSYRGFPEIYSTTSIVVPAPAYAPSVVQATNQSLSITTAAGDPTMWAIIVANWSYDVDGSAGNTHAWRVDKYGGNNLRFDNGARISAQISVPKADLTNGSNTLNGSRVHATGEGASAIVTITTNGTGGTLTLYEMAADGTISVTETINAPDFTAYDMRGAIVTLLADNKTSSAGGIGMWAGAGTMPAIDPVTNPRSFFDLNGRPTGRDALSTVIGAQPMVAEFGDAASWLNTTTDGTETGAVSFGTTPKDGTITDVSASPPAGSFATTSDSDAALLDGTASNYSLTPAVVESFGTGDFDYSGVTLTADRTSICLGDMVYLKINGLTDEQRATWGFLWEFDASGEFLYLEDLPWHVRQRNRAVGHHQAGAWSKSDGPGAKTVRVHIVPPAWMNLKGRTLETVIDNRNPDTEFAGVTVAVRAAGDSDPVTADVIVDNFDAAYSQLSAWDGGRLRLKRGSTHVLSSGKNHITTTWAHGLMFDDWGDPLAAIPVIDNSSGGFNWKRTEPCPFMLIQNIGVQGGYDGITGNNVNSHPAFETNTRQGPITFHGCEFRDVEEACNVIDGKLGAGGENVAFYDSLVTGWENFGIYTAQCRPLIRGCAIFQNPNYRTSLDEDQVKAKNLDGPINRADHGPLRLNRLNETDAVIAQLRCFSFTGWTGAGGGGSRAVPGVTTVAAQPILRLGALSCEGLNALVTECYSEGGGYIIGGGNQGYTVGSGFCAMHGVYHLHHPGWNGLVFGLTGTWARDNVIVVPAGSPEMNNQSAWRVFAGFAEDQVTASWHTKPFNIFDNTVVWLKSEADIGSPPTYDEIMTPEIDNTALVDLPEINIYDNVLWSPNMTLSGEAAPRDLTGLTRAGRYGPLPMYIGFNHVDNGTYLGLYPEYATPATAPEIPIAGSTYEGRDAGDPTRPHGATDFHGRIRAERDQGAVSYEVLKPA